MQCSHVLGDGSNAIPTFVFAQNEFRSDDGIREQKKKREAKNARSSVLSSINAVQDALFVVPHSSGSGACDDRIADICGALIVLSDASIQFCVVHMPRHRSSSPFINYNRNITGGQTE